jgi:hypothetical protein
VTAFVRRRASAGIVAALVLLTVGGCGGSSTELDALEADPMARYEPPGGELLDTRSQEPGSALGKPILARYQRRFRMPRGDPQAQLDAALRAASDAGWDVSDDPVYRFMGSLTQLATKQLPTGDARLSVSVYTNGSPGGSVPGRGLVVSLHHS